MDEDKACRDLLTNPDRKEVQSVVVLCESCRHWGNDGETGTFRDCLRVKHDFAYVSEGEERYRSEEDEESIHDESAVVCDGSGYSARLRTKASFGCVLHESKEST